MLLVETSLTNAGGAMGDDGAVMFPTHLGIFRIGILSV